MGMRHVENQLSELRKTGFPGDLRRAEDISKMLESKGVVEIKPFSKEALEFLKKKHFLYYPLNRHSLKDQELVSRPFWYIVDAGENFLNLPSMQSEAAFPSRDEFLLPKSNKLTLSQQQEMIDEYSYKLQREFGSEELKAVMGDAPDYCLLAFLHLDATKDYLFGEKDNYNFTRTKTPTSGTNVANVGSPKSPHYGLIVNHWDAGLGNDFLYAAPLVVPA